MSGAFLSIGNLTTDELARALAAGGLVALVPLGSSEPHGPHLPLSTDLLLSEEVCRRAALALQQRGKTTLLAPSIAYGVTRYAQGFRGALSLSPSTLVALLVDVGRALLDDGFAHVSFVNNHLEPEHAAAIDQAAQRLAEERGARSVSFPNQLTRRWARQLTDEFKSGNCHAGRYETSLLLASRPDLVRPQASSLPPLAVSLSEAIQAAGGAPVTFAGIGMDRAYTGAPAEASDAEGEATYERLVTMVVTEVLERLGAP